MAPRQGQQASRGRQWTSGAGPELAHRVQIPARPLCCVIDGRTRGRALTRPAYATASAHRCRGGGRQLPASSLPHCAAAVRQVPLRANSSALPPIIPRCVGTAAQASAADHIAPPLWPWAAARAPEGSCAFAPSHRASTWPARGSLMTTLLLPIPLMATPLGRGTLLGRLRGRPPPVTVAAWVRPVLMTLSLASLS